MVGGCSSRVPAVTVKPHTYARDSFNYNSDHAAASAEALEVAEAAEAAARRGRFSIGAAPQQLPADCRGRLRTELPIAACPISGSSSSISGSCGSLLGSSGSGSISLDGC